ncbi:hypothetical protein JCM18694_10100 [Prolixibacter denitrificans]|nr:hypothetical protein JCM18694_10100 [Prolixibacter denitrificans]
MDQRGYASRVPEKKYYLGKNSYFIYNLPLFRVEIKNTGQRTACNFKLKSRAIFFKSSLIYTLDSAQWANPIFQGQSRNISDAIVVPSNDKNDFYYQLSLFWYDSLINSKDSISVTYHCLLRRDSGYDLFGTTEAELERLGNLKSFTIVGRDTSATEAITNYYLPRNIR